MYLLVDVETGGLEPETASLLTGALFFIDDDLNILKEYEFALKSQPYQVCKEAMDVNKINLTEHDKVAKLGYVIAGEIQKLLAFHKDLAGEPLVLLGHNVHLDIKFLKYHLPNVPWNKYVSYKVMDTHGAALFCRQRGELPKTMKKLSLEALAKHYGITYDSHTARGDVGATLEVFKKLLAGPPRNAVLPLKSQSLS